MKFSIILLVIVSVLCGVSFLAGGFYGILAQDKRNAEWTEIEATVVDKWIVEITWKGRYTEITYRPKVKYTYIVDGTNYQCEQVSSFKKQEGNQRWAQEVIQGYRKGQAVVAYYNPQNPSSAYLVKEYIFSEYYGGVLTGMVFLLAGILIYAIGRYYIPTVHLLQEREAGMFEILPRIPVKPKLKASFVSVATWYLSGILTAGHHCYVSKWTYTSDFIIFITIYALIGVLPVIFLIYYYLIVANQDEARILLNKRQVSIREPFVAKFSQVVSLSSIVQESSLTLVLAKEELVKEKRRRATLKTTRCYEDKKSILNQKGLMSPGMLDAELDFNIPTHLNPTSPTNRPYKYGPFYQWYFEVVTKISGSPKYKARFPIIVYP